MSEVHPEVKYGRPKRFDWVNFWVLVGAMGSGGFMFMILATFLGAYYWSFIGGDAISFIADNIWPFICLAYLALQVVPMIVRYQTQGWDVGVDQVTTIIALVGSVAIFTIWAVGELSIDGVGWRIFFETMMTHAVDILLLLAGNKMIAAARGSEEKRIT